MKVLHILWSLTNGGAENMIPDIINYQVNDAEIHLLVINSNVDNAILERIDDKCILHFLNRPLGSKSITYFIRLNWFILTGGFDIVHLHFANLIKRLFIPANYVRTVHNTNQQCYDYRWHKAIIAISESVIDDLSKNGVNNAILINNGINVKSIKLRTNNLGNKSFRIVQVSRIFFEQKGQDILVRAVNQLVDLGYQNIRFDFIGNGEDIEELRDMVSSMNLDQYISILGDTNRNYIYEHLCDYDLFVQPSRYEGFGLTVAEAMAAKVPVLVSRNEGPLKIINNGEFGYSFENQSVEDCAKQIINIIENYPSEQFLTNSYNHVLQNYNVERTASEYLNVYKSVLAS